tara:strand:- start:200 stop:643 length:444 start_codon:yes stop_codon:yes gene_type:complete
MSLFLVGSFNTFLEGTKETVPKGFINKHMYLCSILAVAGAIGSITLIYYSIASPVEFRSFFTKYQKFPYWTIVIPAVILFSYLITNTLALSGGGGIAIAVSNLNMFVTILAGAYLFGDKINYKIILSLIVGVIAVSFGAYESYKLNG